MIQSIGELVVYLRDFHRSWMPDPRLDVALIPPNLASGLATIYRELGALTKIEGDRTPFAAQDALVEPERLKRIDGMIEFAWENQGNWSCRCPVGIDDPPVFSNSVEMWEPAGRGFQKVCDSLNHFLITLCLQEAVMSAPVLLVSHCDSISAAIEGAINDVWRNGQYVHDEPTHDFYEISGQDVLIMRWGGIWIASHDESAARWLKPGLKFQRIL